MNKSIEEQKKPVIKRNLTIEEQNSIDRGKKKSFITSGPIFQASDEGNQQNLKLVIDENLDRDKAIDLLNSRILEATGAVDSAIGLQFLSNVGKSLIPEKVKNEELAKQLNAVAQSMQALAPQDSYEGQLIAQLVVLHEHAMNWLGRAIRTERVDFANVYLNGASKLLARHHETLEALLKYRRKGEQRVHVEHVHVHGGGQAIVGTVSCPGGIKPIIEEGPHAKV